MCRLIIVYFCQKWILYNVKHENVADHSELFTREKDKKKERESDPGTTLFLSPTKLPHSKSSGLKTWRLSAVHLSFLICEMDMTINLTGLL